MERKGRMSEMINKTAPEGNVPLYLFRSGKNSHSYEYMGVHNKKKVQEFLANF